MSASACVILQAIGIGLILLLMWKGRHMTTDTDLSGVEQRIGAALASIKAEIAALTAALQTAAGGDGMTAEQAAGHVTALQGLAGQLEALEAPTPNPGS